MYLFNTKKIYIYIHLNTIDSIGIITWTTNLFTYFTQKNKGSQGSTIRRRFLDI